MLPAHFPLKSTCRCPKPADSANPPLEEAEKKPKKFRTSAGSHCDSVVKAGGEPGQNDNIPVGIRQQNLIFDDYCVLETRHSFGVSCGVLKPRT